MKKPKAAEHLALPGFEKFEKRPRRQKGPKTEKVKVGQTSILIYKLARRGYQFRYYIGGHPHRITRSTLDEAKKEADRIATGIENGRAQTGSMSAVEAESYFHALRELQKLGGAARPMHAALEEYVAAKQVLGSVPLLDAAHAYKRLNPETSGSKSVLEILDPFLASVGDTAENPRYLRGLRCDLRRFVAWLPAAKQRIDQVQTEDIRTYLRSLMQGTMADLWNRRRPKKNCWPAIGARRRDNIRDEIVSLFLFAKSNGYLPEDKVTVSEKVAALDPEHEIKFYTPEQLKAFLAHARTEWVPWLVLGAFAGVRSTEIVGDPEDSQRPRLRWSDFRWEKKVLIVPGLTARKIKKSRRVPLRASLLEWLLPWRNATGPLYPPGSDQSEETMRLAEVTGLPWDNNALRHSYGTYRNAEIGNAGQLAEEMGTSIQMIRKYYDAVPADIEPEEYFGIVSGNLGKIVPSGIKHSG